MESKTYKTLIIGSTFYGVSRLMKNPQESLLVDRGMLFGSEFTDSLNEKLVDAANLKSNFAKQFTADLKARGYIDNDGHIYSALAAFLLVNYLKDTSYNIMLGTEVLDIQKVDDGYDVTLFNSDGKKVIHTEHIIDTTAESRELSSVDYKKSINFVVRNPSDFLAENITYNPVSGLYIYKFPVDKEDSYFEAKEKVYAFWQTNIDKLTDSRIVHVATTFAYDMPHVKKELDRGYIWVPSCGFDNILNAIDCGWEGDF